MQMQDDDVSERMDGEGQIMTYVTYGTAEFLKESFADGGRPICTPVCMQQKYQVLQTHERCFNAPESHNRRMPAGRMNKFTK